MTQVEVSDEAIIKMQKAKEIIETVPASTKAPAAKDKAKKIKIRAHGSKYKKAKKLVDPKKNYSIKDALVLLKKLKYANFDESVELHLVVNKTGLKGEAELPFSSGKQVRVAVVNDKLLEKIEKGKVDFDVLITHPSFMPKLAKYAKFLGPKGLMPNPKAGTISDKPEEAVKKFSKGVIRWKTESKAPLIHQMIGKISTEEKNLQANVEKFNESVGAKNIQKVYLKSTMSPSIKLDTTLGLQ